MKKYISDDKKICEKIRTGTNFLLRAGCGTGKSYAIFHTLKEDKQKFIFLVPNTAVKEQQAEEYGVVPTVLGVVGLSKLIKAKENYIICAYESLVNVKKELLKDYVLVVDEIHSILGDVHYRDNINIIDLSQEAKRVIFVTATPGAIYRNGKIFGISVELLEFKDQNELNVNLYEIKSKNGRITPETLNQLFLHYKKSNKPTLHVISSGVEQLKRITGENVISSKNKTGNYESLVQGILPPGITYSTNLFNAGLSLKNPEEVNLSIDFKRYDLNYEQLAQLVPRFRKSKQINAFIISRGEKNNNKATTKEIIEIIERMVELL
ncbi:MAG: DEAD/DEAH box helicase, partial [Fusobacteriaceae bacterium]